MKNCVHQLNKYNKLKSNDINYITYQNEYNICMNSIKYENDKCIESDIEDEYIAVENIDIVIV
jgi:hypothetical protein